MVCKTLLPSVVSSASEASRWTRFFARTWARRATPTQRRAPGGHTWVASRRGRARRSAHRRRRIPPTAPGVGRQPQREGNDHDSGCECPITCRGFPAAGAGRGWTFSTTTARFRLRARLRLRLQLPVFSGCAAGVSVAETARSRTNSEHHAGRQDNCCGCTVSPASGTARKRSLARACSHRRPGAREAAPYETYNCANPWLVGRSGSE